MKKIYFGSIFSAFLIVSIAWLNPVNVQAFETEKQEIKDMLFDFVTTFSEDEDFEQMLNDSDIRYFSEKIINAETEIERDGYAEDLEYLIKTRYIDLIERYIPSFEEIKQKIQSINIDVDALRNDLNQENNYKLDVKSDGFTITKQKGENIEGDAILINGNNGSIKLPEYGWIDQDLWDDLLDFLNDLVLGIMTVFEAILLFLEVIMLVFMILDIIFGKKTDFFYLMTEHILSIVLYITGWWIRIEFTLMAVIKVIEFLSEVIKAKTISKTSSFMQRIISLFKQFQKRIDIIMGNFCYS